MTRPVFHSHVTPTGLGSQGRSSRHATPSGGNRQDGVAVHTRDQGRREPSAPWTAVSRRTALLSMGSLYAATLGTAWLAERSMADEPTASPLVLEATPAVGTVRRVRVAVEITGDLKMNPTERGVERLPLSVKADLVYDERTLPGAVDGTIRGLRHYDTAKAEFRIGDAKTPTRTVTMPAVLVASDPTSPTMIACPTHLLSRDELELIDLPGSSTLWPNLVPRGAVTVGQTTTISKEMAAKLFGLDLVHQSDVEVVVESITDSQAQLTLRGHLAGSIEGVSSDIDVAGSVVVDRTKSAVASVALTMKETRAIGHATPGYDATVTIRMASVGVPTPERLSDAAMANLTLPLPEPMRLLRWQGDLTNVRLIHDRRWRLMSESPEMAQFRMIDQGELIAQVNVAILPALKEGESVSLDAFEKEIKAKLAEHSPLIKARSEYTNQRGLKTLRLVVEGRVQQMPIRWIYYHQNNEAGRRASLIFVHDQQLTERFGEADNWLAQSLEFLTAKAGTPSPAEAQTASGQKSVLKR